jgi:hypothetical protein
MFCLNLFRFVICSDFLLAFEKAKERFLRNSKLWLDVVVGVPDMLNYVDAFIHQLDIFFFTNHISGLLMGLSSITGKYRFMSDHLMKYSIEYVVYYMEHEICQTFFQFIFIFLYSFVFVQILSSQ